MLSTVVVSSGVVETVGGVVDSSGVVVLGSVVETGGAAVPVVSEDGGFEGFDGIFVRRALSILS